MAKSYFGKFEDQWEAQKALDEGQLLNPFVAVWEDTVHYNDLEPVEPGEVEPKSFTDVSWSGDSLVVSITAPNSMHWEIKDYDTDALTIPQFGGWGDGTPTITVNENDGISSRDLSFSVYFDYPDSTAHTRNIETVTIQQNAASVEPGYVHDGGGTPVTAITATYQEGTAAYLYPATYGEKPLYWFADSDADWFFFGNTQSAWTNSGEPTEIYAYQNPGVNSRSTNITVSFYLDDQMQNLVNTVTIPFTQAGHIVQPGYAEVSAITLTNYGQETYFMVYGDELYWRMTANNGWITFNWGDTGQGTQQKAIRVNQNRGKDRSGSFTISFYLDEEMTILKNTFVVTVDQTGENQYVVSWNDDYEEQVRSVGPESGTTTVYILNNPDNAYWATWIDGNYTTGSPETTAITWTYQANDSYYQKNLSAYFNFYEDDTFQSQFASAYAVLIQAGDPNVSHVEFENADVEVPSSGGTKVADIILLGDAVKWEFYVDDQALSFPDYPGENTITGDSSTTAVTIAVSATTDFGGNQRNVFVRFFDQNDDQIGSQQQAVFWQKAYRPVTALLDFNNETHVYLPGSFTGDVVFNITVGGGLYYKFEDNNEVLISSGDTTTAVTAATISQPNTSGSQTGMGYHLTVYTDSDYTNVAYDDWMGYDQFTLPGDDCPYLEYVEYHDVSTDGETQRVCNNQEWGGYYQFVVYDGTYCVEPLDGPAQDEKQFTFPQSGSHTLTYIKINYDNMLSEGACMNTDAVSAELIGHNMGYSTTPSGGYGFDGYAFADCTALTAVTFDEYVLDIGGDGTDNTTFDGCTSLTTINCYNPNEPAINATSFNTITANTGTLHIPSGSTYSNWAAALGSNWTVVDDL